MENNNCPLQENYFAYSKNRLAKLIEQYKALDLKEATMSGVHSELEHLKGFIEEFYKRNIFYLDDWIGECGFHGWDWSKDDGSMKSMKYITEGIVDKFIEIYALILVGLGQEADDIK